ncbi:hypothetical protein Ddye_016034 [Dipteronia dyeriana]|uniref:Uncharacterized protein n=1 Tax=Dipteronia dyeriana TaxID=168575 RepID=A0AAD9U602_9ROSI|nr:hypothetical protein Ddye_016034 [Dipteronia dyeriana]
MLVGSASSDKEIQELKKGKQKKSRKDPLGKMNVSFSRRFKKAELPPKFKISADKYSVTEDPPSPLDSFIKQMEVKNATREAMFRMFPTTLSDYVKRGSESCPQATWITSPNYFIIFAHSFRGSNRARRIQFFYSITFKSARRRSGTYTVPFLRQASTGNLPRGLQ